MMPIELQKLSARSRVAVYFPEETTTISKDAKKKKKLSLARGLRKDNCQSNNVIAEYQDNCVGTTRSNAGTLLSGSARFAGAASGPDVTTSLIATFEFPKQYSSHPISKMPRLQSTKISPNFKLRGSMERRRSLFFRNPAKLKEIDKTSNLSKMESTGIIEEDGDSDEDLSPDALIRQNFELRHRLEEDAAIYKKRLETYRQAQQHQAALVSRLQAKVLQYKQRCSELENHMTESTSFDYNKPFLHSLPENSALNAAQQTLRDVREDQIQDLETALKKLSEERKKCEKLMQLNSSMKDQLEESHQVNEALTNDLQKLSNEWDAMRDEMTMKEEEWKEEEQAFNEYYSSEHHKFLSLWRNVVAVKRLFSEIKYNTELDISKMKNDFANATTELMSACSNANFVAKLKNVSTLPKMMLHEQAANDLKTEITNLKQQFSVAQNEIRTKDDRINQLIREIHVLEERCAEAESGLNQASKMQEDAEILQSALRDIAHAVIQDAESRETENIQPPPHIHLSPGVQVQKSPKRARNNNVPAFAESTISAVQAALHKYQLVIHELQVKLQSNKDQLILTRKNCETAENNVQILEEKLGEVVVHLDSSRHQCNQLIQEKESMQKNLQAMKIEKTSLEKNRIEINCMIETLNGDYEKLQKHSSKLQKLCDVLESEKLYLQSEVDRLNKDSEMRELTFRTEEERCSKLREEFLTLREDLNKANLAKEMLEQQNTEANNLVSQIEKNKGDLELELERVVLEKSDVQQVLVKMETICFNHEQDKFKLQEELNKITEERNKFSSQCSDQQCDLNSLRKELLQAEQTRLDLESEKVNLNEKIKFLELEKEKLEMELGQVTRERGDLSNQLSILARKKETLNEELMRIRQRLEQAGEMNGRLNRNLEDLVKDNLEKQIILEAGEKEMQRYQELLASLRSEKETLEGVLFDTQTNLEATHIKKSQMEKEQQELLIKQESLKQQVTSLTKELEISEKRAQDIKHNMIQQSEQREAEYEQIILNIKKQNEDGMKKLNEEKEQIRLSLEKRLQQSISQLAGEKDNEVMQLQQRIEELHQHNETICQQHEEVLLRAENDKQQALLIAHHDQQALIEKLESAYRDLEEEKGILDRVRRETGARAEQDRNLTNQLREELNRLRSKFDEMTLQCEDEKAKLEIKIEEVLKERETVRKEVEELQVQLHIAEDKIDGLNNQVYETTRKIKDGENSIESLRKELVDTRRQLTDSDYEKDKYNSSNKELREYIKRIESEKREQARTLEETYQKLAALEDAKNSLESDKINLQSTIHDLERQIMNLEQQVKHVQDDLQKSQASICQGQNDEKELQSRLANEMEERERLQLQLHQAKKQISELDNNLEVTRQELGRMRCRADEETERWRAREQELVVRIDEGRCRERKLEDQKHNLEVCLADATQQLQELKARLSGAEGRIRALDAQLAQLEAEKKEAEQKLSSVGSTLRRIAGIQLDGSISLPYKLMSPSRRWSPVRVSEHNEIQRDVIIDVDPESVRKGVRNLMQQVAQIERERDDCKTELNNLKKQLSELQNNQQQSEKKINSMSNTLRSLQEEKTCLETKLSQKQGAYQINIETLQAKTEEVGQLRERVTHLELLVSNESEEKSLYEEKLDKLRTVVNKLENEKRNLQEDLGRSEARSTKMELQRMSLEGDLQRLQMILQEKDVNIQKLQDRYDVQIRTISSLEERCSSLKTTIEQLNCSLEKASNTESEMRAQISSLQKSLIESNSSAQTNNEKVKQYQKQLSHVENERRLLTERLESLQETLTNTKHLNETLNAQNSRLQNELATVEVQKSGVEAQLRIVNWSHDSDTNKDEELVKQLYAAQKERSELKGKVDALSDKVKYLESEKRNLERQLSSSRSGYRSKSYERPEKAYVELIGSSIGIDALEHENRELRLKIRKLESCLTEKEAEILQLKKTQNASQSPLQLVRADKTGELERLRAAQLQAEKLLEAREMSHRHQIMRLESQVQILKEQLSQEIKRRQMYVLRSSRAGREMQQLRQALGDSLRTVAQDPSLDAMLLEHEARKLDCTLSSSSLPPSLALPPPPSSLYERRSQTPSSLK